MTMANRTSVTEATQAVLLDDPDFSREIVERTVQAILDEEMTAHLGAERYEHSGERRGYHNGTKPRMLMTRVGSAGASRSAGSRRDLFDRGVRALPIAASRRWSPV